MNTELVRNIMMSIYDEYSTFKSTILVFNIVTIIVAYLTVHPTIGNLLIGVVLFNVITLGVAVLMIALCIVFGRSSVKS